MLRSCFLVSRSAMNVLRYWFDFKTLIIRLFMSNHGKMDKYCNNWIISMTSFAKSSLLGGGDDRIIASRTSGQWENPWIPALYGYCWWEVNGFVFELETHGMKKNIQLALAFWFYFLTFWIKTTSICESLWVNTCSRCVHSLAFIQELA